MVSRKEKQLLQIIRYAPLLFVLLASFIITTFSYQAHKRDLHESQKSIEKQFIEDENIRIQSNINGVYNYAKREKENAENKLKDSLKTQILNAHSISNGIYNKYKNKKTTHEIKKLIKSALRDVRFNNGRGYFYIYTVSGTNILHPTRPEREGKHYTQEKNRIGIYADKKAIDTIKNNDEGFITYEFNKPNDIHKEYKKIAYFKKTGFYDWYIGTGEYIDEFTNDLKLEVIEEISHLRYKNDGFIGLLNYDGTFLYHKSGKIINANVFTDKRFEHVKEFYLNLLSKDNKTNDSWITIELKVQNTNKKEMKTIYSKKFDDWGFIFSTGYRLSDINAVIEQRKKILEKNYQEYLNSFYIFAVITTIGLLLISFFLSKLFKKRFIAYKAGLEKQIVKNVKQKNILLEAQKVAHIGDWKYSFETGKIKLSNEIISIFGINDSSRYVSPMYLRKIVYKEDLPIFDKSLEEVRHRELQHHLIFRIVRSDGAIKWIECRGEYDLEKNYLLGTLQDVTETKELEIEKGKQDELLFQQSKLASMGEMIGNIAHQLKQPLSIITMQTTSLDLSIEMGEKISNTKYLEVSKSVTEQAEYLANTIDDFRDFFKPEKEKETYCLDTCYHNAYRLIKSKFVNHNIKIIENLEEIRLCGFPREMIQVIMNIMNNARDALEFLGKNEKIIFIEMHTINEEVVFKIKDNAGGIEEGIIENVFDAYFTTKDSKKGTGVGLFMSKDIIEKHMEGTIKVYNESFNYKDRKYTGACFEIRLPYDDSI